MESNTELAIFTSDAIKMVMALPSTNISSVNDLIALVAPIMRLAKNYTHLSGTQKKDVVLLALKKVLSLSKLDDSVKAPISFAIDTVIPPVIDQLYSIKPEDFKKLFSCCC